MSKWQKMAQNWDDIGESGLTVGIKPIKIIEVIDNENDEFVEILFDIAAGPEKDYFTNKSKNSTWHGWGKFKKYYRSNTLRFFKSFITAVEKSNEGYSFSKTNGDISKLVGKIVYGVFEKQQTTIVGDDGKPLIAIKLNYDNLRSKQAFIDKEIEVPSNDFVRELNDWEKEQFNKNLEEWKKSGNTVKDEPKETYTATATVIDTDDLPF